MTGPMRKALRDVWAEKGRSVLVVLAIALGIAAFTAVLASRAILVRELNRQYLATNPASAVLRTDVVDDALLARVAAVPGIGEVEARRVVSARVRGGTASWRTLVLFAAKDLSKARIGAVIPEAGAWPPADGELAVERDAFQVANVSLGDLVTVRTTDGRERRLRVAGRVHDVGQAQARMENVVYGYASLGTLAMLGVDPVPDRVALVASDARFDEGRVRRIAEAARAALEAAGHPVTRVDVPPPGKHPHADIMGLLLLTMSAFGLFVLLVAAVLVVNLVTSLLASQVRQIGVMKAVGATRGRVARIYLLEAAVLGGAAVLVGIPAGLAGSRALCRYLAVFLNFDVASFEVPPWIFGAAFLVGLAVPLLAAARPVWRASGVSVREALFDFGVARTEFGVTRLERALAGVRGLARPVLLALRDTFRRGRRLSLTVSALAAGGVFFMGALNVRTSLVRTLDRLFSTRRFDLAVSLGSMSDMEKAERAARATPGVEAVEGWIATEGSLVQGAVAPAEPHVSGSGLHGGRSALGPDRFPVLAIPAGTSMLAPVIVSGRNLVPADSDALLVNSAFAARWKEARPGASVVLGLGPSEKAWRVVGIASEPLAPPVAYIPRRLFDEMHPGMANALRVRLARRDPEFLEAEKGVLESSLAAEGLLVSSVSSQADARRGFDEHMVMIYVFLVVMSAIVGAVGTLGLATSVSLDALERRRETGVLRAIGAGPRDVALLLAARGVLVALLAWLAATLLSAPLGAAIADHLLVALFKSRVASAFDARGPMIWLGVSVLASAAASAFPAWRASRRPVREALAYE